MFSGDKYAVGENLRKGPRGNLTWEMVLGNFCNKKFIGKKWVK